MAATASKGWTIKGVPNETIDLVRIAARQRGMRIGAWVSETIKCVAEQQLDQNETKKKSGETAPPWYKGLDEEILRQIGELGGQARAIEQEVGLLRRAFVPLLKNEDQERK